MIEYLKQLFQEDPYWEEVISEKQKEKDIPQEQYVRIWNEAVMPGMTKLLRQPGLFNRQQNKQHLTSLFAMFDRMLETRIETAFFVSGYTMKWFLDNPKLIKQAQPYMSEKMDSACEACVRVYADPDAVTEERTLAFLMFGITKLFDKFPPWRTLFKNAHNPKDITSADPVCIWHYGFMVPMIKLLTLPEYQGTEVTGVMVGTLFSLFEVMLDQEHTADLMTEYGLKLFYEDPELFELAKPIMKDSFRERVEAYCARQKELAASAEEQADSAAEEPAAPVAPPKPQISAATADQFAPIIPYVGAGGLRLGWTKEQVEKVTGPLGDYVAVAQLWRRYTVGDLLWLYFNGPGDGLEKIVTLPGYGGRLFSLIDTNTPVEELSWREPSFTFREDLGFYVSPKGVMIHPVDGKATHITIFANQWKELVE